MTTPKVKKCPKCNTTKVTEIPSSTMPIDDRTGTYFGTRVKVPAAIMKEHLSIHFICNNCTYEW